MNNKLTIGLLAILTAAVLFLAYQNQKLNTKIDGLSQAREVSITPVDPGEASPEGASPFDKPNVDPLANQFPSKELNSAPPTSINFDRTVHDFGKIKEGVVAKTVFKFTNSGKNPLIISNATGSCGCTVPDWPKEPIKPGESAEIKVEFNSEGKKGENEKSVTVTANTEPSTSVLYIKSTVIPKDK